MKHYNLMSKQEKQQRANNMWLVALVTSAFSGIAFVSTLLFNPSATQSWTMVAWGAITALSCVTCMVRETMNSRG